MTLRNPRKGSKSIINPGQLFIFQECTKLTRIENSILSHIHFNNQATLLLGISSPQKSSKPKMRIAKQNQKDVATIQTRENLLQLTQKKRYINSQIVALVLAQIYVVSLKEAQIGYPPCFNEPIMLFLYLSTLITAHTRLKERERQCNPHQNVTLKSAPCLGDYI